MDEFGYIKFGGEIPMKLFSFRCDLVDYENEWEKEYIQELIKILCYGMTVYDVGAENGELSVLAACMVGGGNVHIFEPNKNYFPNIAALWVENRLWPPKNCFNGYVYETSSPEVKYNTLESLSDGEIFRGCLHPNHIDTPMQMVSLDDYCKTFNPPDVVMMDIEGGELAAVRGAKGVIEKHSPIFFISIHKPEFIMHRSNGTKEDLIKIFTDNGYIARHLSTDHEEHWKFIPKSK